MPKKKFYAIARGHKPGIYRDWPSAKAQVSGYTGASYRGFATLTEAKQWLVEQQAGKQLTISSNYAQEPVTRAESKPITNHDQIQVFTDGGSRNTGNKLGGHVNTDDLAAWAYLVVWPDGHQVSDTAGEFGATNNKMELQALLSVLTYLVDNKQQHEPITVTSDSRYLLNAIEKGWLAGWQQRGWRKADGSPVANMAIWEAISTYLPQFSQLTFQWAKGHATNDGNVFVDELLNKTMDQMQ